MEGGGAQEVDRMSRRDLLRRMLARMAGAAGAAAVRAPAASPALEVPYVPYTSRPQQEEEQA